MQTCLRIVTVSLALALGCLNSSLHAFPGHLTLESARPRDFLPYIDPATLVVIEVEDVLLSTQQHLGSEQWAEYIVRQLCARGLSPAQARAEITPLWNRILEKATFTPVDLLFQSALRSIQRCNCACIGFTLKDSEISATLLRRLSELDTDFGKTTPRSGTFIITSEAPAKLINGVLFAGVYNEPGLVLLRFFEQSGYRPNRVVIVSSRGELLQAIGGVLESRGISCIGIRYAGHDEHAAAFRPELAEIQLNFFEEILSDEAAAALTKRSSFWPF